MSKIFGAASIVTIIILILYIGACAYTAYLGYLERSEERWQKKTFKSVLFSILVFPILTSFDMATNVLMLIEMYDDGNFWSPDRGPEYANCSKHGSKMWVVGGLFFLVMYPVATGSFEYWQSGNWLQGAHQFTGYNILLYIRKSMRKGVPVFELWEHTRWQAAFLSFTFFCIGVYFVSETLSPDRVVGEVCANSPTDAFWVYWSISLCAICMMLVFRQEDLYLLPTTLYKTENTVLKSFDDVNIFQDEADDALVVAQNPENMDEVPLRKNDIVTKIADVDFSKNSDEDLVTLWAEQRQQFQTDSDIEIVYQREWEYSALAISLGSVMLFCWRLSQIACRILTIVFYYREHVVRTTVSYLIGLLVMSWTVRLVSKKWNLSNNVRVSYMDVLYYGMMNILILDLRYLVRLEIASSINILFIIDFFIFFISYCLHSNMEFTIVLIISILLATTIIGLIVILYVADLNNFVNVRNRNIAKLLKYDQFQLIEALIVFRAITLEELGKDNAPKVILLLSRHEAVDVEQLIDVLYKSKEEYEERLKTLFLKEICVRLQEGLKLGMSTQCPTISVNTFQEKLKELFGIVVSADIIQKFFDMVHQTQTKKMQSRQNYKTLAPLWQTELPGNNIQEKYVADTLPAGMPALNLEPSKYITVADPEDPTTEKLHEVSLDILCGYIVDAPAGRFIETISKVLFHYSVECHHRVDRSLSEHLKEYLFEKKNQTLETKSVDKKERQVRESKPATAAKSAELSKQLFLQTVPCLKSFPNVHFDEICELVELERIEEQNVAIKDFECIYIIKRGNILLEDKSQKDQKLILEKGDWFGYPMTNWAYTPSLHTHGEGAVELYTINAKEYERICGEARETDPNFIDYLDRQPPDISEIEKYMKMKMGDVVSRQQIYNPDAERQGPKRRSRKVPDSSKQKQIMEIFKCVPCLGGLFKKELDMLLKFCITENLKKSSRKWACDGFLFITMRGIAKVWKKMGNKDQEVDPPLPCRAINLKQMLESDVSYQMKMVGSTALAMILVPEEVFSVVKTPCASSLEKIVKLRDKEIPQAVAWTEKLIKDVKIGAGGFANVYLMSYIGDEAGGMVAMKRTSKGHIQANRMFDWVLQEQYCMYMVDHQFVVGLTGSLQDDQFTYFLLDYCPGNSLFDLLMHERLPNPHMDTSKERSYYLTEEHARFYSACAVLGLEALHSRRIVHRDIKSDNMLIDKDGYLVLTDLGFAKPIGEMKTYTICGTKEYFAPELVNKKAYDFGVDWWALGVAIYDMMTGYIPFDKPRKKLRQDQIDAGKISLFLHDHLSRSAQDLLRGLLRFDVQKRFGHRKRGGITYIKNHSFFRGDDDFSWHALERRQQKPPWVPNVDKPVGQMKDAPYIKYPRTQGNQKDPFADFLGTKYKGNVKWKTPPPSSKPIKKKKSSSKPDK